MALEKAAAVLGQTDRMVAVTGHARGLDQPLFAQVSQVAGPWISRATVVVAEITTGDNSERTNGCECSRFGAAQGVLAITVANDARALARAAGEDGELNASRTLTITFSIVAIAFGPAGIVIAFAVRRPSDPCRSLPDRVRATVRHRYRGRACGSQVGSSRHHDRDHWSRCGLHDSASESAARRLANRSHEDRNP